MILEVRAVAPFMKNGYVLACPATHEAVVIDPGDEVDQLVATVAEKQLRVRHILLTHAHIDHISGVAVAKAAFAAPIGLHRDDLFLYERVKQQGVMFGIDVVAQPPVDHFYEGERLTFGEFEVRVHHTPGHSPGEVCLQVGPEGTAGQHLFVGDSLFAGSVGRTDLPGGSYETLMRSITGVIFALGEDAVVHPGHGPDTTVARERARNPFVVEYLAERQD